MKIKLFIAAVFLSLASCNEKNKEDNIATSKVELLTSMEETEDTAKQEAGDSAKNKQFETSEIPSSRTASKPLLIARGSEPGWYAEFYSDHVLLILDYGKDSVKAENDFSNITKDKTYTAKIVSATNNNGKKTSVNLEVDIENKPCTEMSGEKRDKAITVKYNNKEYKGCAETK